MKPKAINPLASDFLNPAPRLNFRYPVEEHERPIRGEVKDVSPSITRGLIMFALVVIVLAFAGGFTLYKLIP